jgi:adenylate cyclase
MKEEKWFQNPSLSLRELAENVNISSNKLSWLLNERIGQNFNEYINVFVWSISKSKALNPANSHLTLLGWLMKVALILNRYSIPSLKKPKG